jgi:hypothetical protein
MRLAASNRAKTHCKNGPDSPSPLCSNYRVGETAGSSWEWKEIKTAPAPGSSEINGVLPTKGPTDDPDPERAHFIEAVTDYKKPPPTLSYAEIGSIKHALAKRVPQVLQLFFQFVT